MSPIIAQITEVAKAAEQAASQSDRYLMIFVSLCFFLFLGWLVRYFISKNEELHRQYSATLESLFTRSNESNKTMAVAIDRNTEALKSMEERCGDCRFPRG